MENKGPFVQLLKVNSPGRSDGSNETITRDFETLERQYRGIQHKVTCLEEKLLRREELYRKSSAITGKVNKKNKSLDTLTTSDKMALKIVDSIEVVTQQGECEIQLLCGDITKLPKNEKVDFILVSAFPGNYFTTRRSVIGALNSELSINVEALSRHKEMDLRNHFYCWMSKKLPDDKPFNRVICLERNYRLESGHLSEQIRTMFRAFVPLFSNEPSTVIAPLLGTGSQGHNKASILKSMVDAAHHWIHAGLPLKCFKIVVYSQNSEETGKLEKELIEVFSKYKKSKTLVSDGKMKLKKQRGKKYDVYLSYSLEDKHWADLMYQVLCKSDSLKDVYRERQTIKEDEIFQDHIFQIMISCQRVIVLLSPSFMNSSDCLEQFNIAMCCNRMKKTHVLAPFYVETISPMPTYMSLVQFVDCRKRKEGDDTEMKIRNGCSTLLESVNQQELHYDVFISYSHKNPKEVEVFLKYFAEHYSELKIFFDRSELKTGNLWQKTLYEALDCSSCIITLISSTYLTSAVCQEEYSIALAKSVVNFKSVQLIPVCTEDIETVPAWMGYLKMVDGRKNLELTAASVCDAIYQWINTRAADGRICMNIEPSLNLNDIMELVREEHMKTNYIVTFEKINPVQFKEKPINQTAKSKIVVGYAPTDYTHALILSSLLQDKLSSVDIVLAGGQVKDTLKNLEDADKIVLFLSKSYVNSVTLMEQLHLALVRHRSSSAGPVVHFILSSQLPKYPIFTHLLPCKTSLIDNLWIKNTKRAENKVKSFRIKNLTESQGSYSVGVAEFMALEKASWDLVIELTHKVENPTRNTVIENIVQVDMNQKQPPDYSKKVPLMECLRSMETKPASVIVNEKSVYQGTDNAHQHTVQKVDKSVDNELDSLDHKGNEANPDKGGSIPGSKADANEQDNEQETVIAATEENKCVSHQAQKTENVKSETSYEINPASHQDSKELSVSVKESLKENEVKRQANKNLNSNSSNCKSDNQQQANSPLVKDGIMSDKSPVKSKSPEPNRRKQSTRACDIV